MPPKATKSGSKAVPQPAAATVAPPRETLTAQQANAASSADERHAELVRVSILSSLATQRRSGTAATPGWNDVTESSAKRRKVETG